MASGLYDLAREKFLNGQIDWADDNIKAMIVDAADYTVNLATDEFLDDVAAGARVGTTGNLTGKTTAAGVADAADATISTVTGDPTEAVVVYKDTGDAATSPLICFFENVTVTPNGGNITLQWNASGLFKL